MALTRKARLKSQARIPQWNPERAKKRAARYSAYLHSPEWREKVRQVRERSGGRCEIIRARFGRCPLAARSVHHLGYGVVGLDSVSVDRLVDVCDGHHAWIEAQAKPWLNARRRALSSGWTA